MKAWDPMTQRMNCWRFSRGVSSERSGRVRSLVQGGVKVASLVDVILESDGVMGGGLMVSTDAGVSVVSVDVLGVVVSASCFKAFLVVLGTVVGCSRAYSLAEFNSTFNAFASPQSGGSILPTSMSLLIKVKMSSKPRCHCEQVAFEVTDLVFGTNEAFGSFYHSGGVSVEGFSRTNL